MTDRLDGDVPARGGTRHLACETCGAHLAVDEDRRTATCSYCASPAIIERPATPERPNPSLAIGFTITHERALAQARRWLGRALFAPRSFRRATVETLSGVYVPAYLYTAAAYSWYRAMIGEPYEVVETVRGRDEDGEPTTRKRRKTRYEWRSLSGDHAVYISDHVVTASRGLDDRELQGITPFDLRSVQRFRPELIAGWIAEEPTIEPHRATEMARAQARTRLARELQAFLPGERRRLLDCSTHFHHEHVELALLPIWVLPVRYDREKPPIRLLVNGQTGAVHGRAPISVFKILVLAALALVATVALFFLAPPGG